MGRTQFIPSGRFPYHVLSRTNNREPFPIPMREVWRIFCNEIRKTQEKFDFRPYAFVLMPNHFHLIVRTPDEDLPRSMHRLLTAVSRSIGRKADRINHIFSDRYRRCLIEDVPYLVHAIKYVYRNPVEAGLVEETEQYPFSTLPAALGRAPNPFNLSVNELGNDVPAGQVLRQWLAQGYSPEQRRLLKRALGRSRFRLPGSPRYVRIVREFKAPELGV